MKIKKIKIYKVILIKILKNLIKTIDLPQVILKIVKL